MTSIWYFLLSTALGQDAVSLSVIEHGQLNTANPALILKVNQALSSLDVSIQCAGQSFEHHKAASRGNVQIDFPVKQGKHQCQGSLSIEMDDGSGGEMPLKFGIQMHAPLKISVPTEDVDLEKAQLIASLDRPAAEYQITIFDSQNDTVGQGFTSVPANQNLSPQKISWESLSDDIAVIRVQGKDVYGFYSQMDLFPWHYNIPHEDVVFASNSYKVDSTEVHKLTDVQKDVQTVVNKYSHFASVNLYVAGYTDTVGDPSSNLKLSEERAKSIATWFKENGFQGEIYYQGFGESVLMIPTADGVDQPENRRAVYMIGATFPKSSTDIPKNNWKKLP